LKRGDLHRGRFEGEGGGDLADAETVHSGRGLIGVTTREGISREGPGYMLGDESWGRAKKDRGKKKGGAKSHLRERSVSGIWPRQGLG